MGGSPQDRLDRDAEWYRRRRADKDGIPLPPEFRLFDDEESIAVRFPVHVAPSLFRTIFPYRGTGTATSSLRVFAILVLSTGGAILFCGLYLVLIVSAFAAVITVPLLLLMLLRRTVTIRPEGVEVGWWPIPFLARRLVSRQVTQVFVTRAGAQPVDVFPGDPDPGLEPEFDVCILRPDGSREVLVRSLLSAEHALFLERWLERRLGIEDAPVAGEFG